MGVNRKLNRDLRPWPFAVTASGPFIRRAHGALHCAAPRRVVIPFPPLAAGKDNYPLK